MCGITGIFNLNNRIVKREILESMTNILVHRGPDGDGLWIENNIGFGHRRLAIIDLSEVAKQPMLSADGLYTITYNGEIYNYKELRKFLIKKGILLRTNSDTETILYLYQLFGQNCISYLRGMFAFAIWDGVKKELFIARDRVGIKPLYYLHKEEVFVFASELKSIVASGYSDKRLDTKALLNYLSFLTFQQPDSVFDDIKKLEPGHFIVLKSCGTIKTVKYWEIDNTAFSNRPNLSEKDYVDSLNGQLLESVKYHMISDVPVGAFLSGGVDSSSIVALMRENEKDRKLNTYSIGFPGLSEFDESVYANKVSSLFNTNHHSEKFTDEFLSDFKDICWYMDEPFAVSSSFATYQLSKIVSKNAKVVLTGDGGDEMFAGYEGYKNNNYLHTPAYKLQLYSQLYIALNFVTKHLNNKVTNQLLAGLHRRIGNEGVRFSNLVSQNAMYTFGVVLNPNYYRNALQSWNENLIAKYYNDVDSDDVLLKKLYSTFKTRLVDEMLMKVDRMTMAHSLEARVPLLDHNLVNMAFSIPANLKLHEDNGAITGKYILKKTMEKYLPDNILYRSKQGFNIPHFLTDSKQNLANVKEILLSGFLIKNQIISEKGLIELLGMLNHKGRNVYNMIMMLYTYEIWCQNYSEKFGGVTLK